MSTRRTFLHVVALTAAGATVGHAATALPPAARTHQVRRNSLGPGGPGIAALRAGIVAMRAPDASGGDATNPQSRGHQRVRWRPWTLPPIPPLIVDLCERIPRLCQPIPLPTHKPWPIPIDGPRPVPIPIVLRANEIQALVETRRRAAGALDAGLVSLQLVMERAPGSPILVAEARPAGRGFRDAPWIRAGAASGSAATGRRETVDIDISELLGRLGSVNGGRDLEWRLRFSSGRVGADAREVPLSNEARARARVFGAGFTIPEAARR